MADLTITCPGIPVPTRMSCNTMMSASLNLLNQPLLWITQEPVSLATKDDISCYCVSTVPIAITIIQQPLDVCITARPLLLLREQAVPCSWQPACVYGMLLH